MKIWILIVFGFNLNYMSLETHEFSTHEACLAAASIVQKPVTAVSGSPVSNMTNVGCVEDTK